MYSFIKAVCATALFSASLLHASPSHPSDHAPIGVMGDHLHQKGEWMTSYRYAHMGMKGNRSNQTRISTQDVFAEGFMVAPTSMDMEMHMFGLMYGVSDALTVMAMLPYIEIDMAHKTLMGHVFRTESQGMGDAKISGLYRLYEGPQTKMHATLSLSLPTGSIDARDDTPVMQNAVLPYPMQLGSGMFDPSIGLTATHHSACGLSIGGQAMAIFRLYENKHDYRLGNRYHLTGWAAYDVNEYVSLSARLSGEHWEDIRGADTRLNPMMVPTARTNLRGGTRLDAAIGMNVQLPEDLGNARLAIEYQRPIWQKLDGPQLEVDHRLMLGLQWSF